MNFTDSPYEKMMKQVPRPPRSAHIKKKQPSDRRNRRRKSATPTERPDNG
ncbi:hypothetical protein [Christensenella intestinihominis]|nr:hypothetical protein [Christensenella intestinihominis]